MDNEWTEYLRENYMRASYGQIGRRPFYEKRIGVFHQTLIEGRCCMYTVYIYVVLNKTCNVNLQNATNLPVSRISNASSSMFGERLPRFSLCIRIMSSEKLQRDLERMVMVEM